MTQIVGRLCLPRHGAAKAGQTPILLNRRFAEPASKGVEARVLTRKPGAGGS
jgi:hypothetical protein